MSGAHVRLATLVRQEGVARLIVSQRPDGVELAQERRMTNGWQLVRRLVVGIDELSVVTRALLSATAIAEARRR
jgi:hypothetical protein